MRADPPRALRRYAAASPQEIGVLRTPAGAYEASVHISRGACGLPARCTRLRKNRRPHGRPRPRPPRRATRRCARPRLAATSPQEIGVLRTPAGEYAASVHISRGPCGLPPLDVHGYEKIGVLTDAHALRGALLRPLCHEGRCRGVAVRGGGKIHTHRRAREAG